MESNNRRTFLELWLVKMKSKKFEQVSPSIFGLRHLLDKVWRNKATGEVQLKAAAEAMRINIDFIDGDKLESQLARLDYQNMESENVETKKFRPTPILMDGTEAEPVESQFGPDKARTVFLWREHYYPLFRKGTFPNLRKIPKHHHVGAQVSTPPLSSNSETRTNNEDGATIANVLEKITMHQNGIAESILKGRTKPPPSLSKPISQPNKPPPQPLHDKPPPKGVRPGKEHWDPYHNSLILYTGKKVPWLEELPPQPFVNGGQKDVVSPVEHTGMNGWAAFSLGAVVATLTAAVGAVGWRIWKRPSVKTGNEKRARDVNYYSDDEELNIRAKW